jgi:predicted DNA-binding transcriptional regulator AlpA
MHDDDELWTIDQVSAFTHIAKDTLYGWRSRRVGPPSFKIGNGLKYWRSGVLAWLADQEAADPRYAPPGGRKPARRVARSVTKQAGSNRSGRANTRKAS